MTKLSLLRVVRDTIVDGPGFRTAVYSAGCAHHCKGCHNPASWNLATGNLVPVTDLMKQILEADNSGVTFSGGDPMFQVEAFTELARMIKEQTQKNIWCYTGYEFDEVLGSERLSRILPYIDVMVDGRFVEEEKDPGLIFRGSKNQRLIDVQRSLVENKVVLYDYSPFPTF